MQTRFARPTALVVAALALLMTTSPHGRADEPAGSATAPTGTPAARQTDDPAKMSVIDAKPRPRPRRLVVDSETSPWRFHAIRWYLATCAFIIGACVGSFLNVVVYRLPLRMGLLRADSHCPVCKMPIALKDNVPIFGWLKLRGRCRECAVRISPRYMLVELGTALMFLVLAVTELLSGGGNLPGHVAIDDGVSPLAALNADLIGLYLTHCFFVSALLCCALITVDGHDLPRTLVLPTLLVGLFSPYRAATTLPVPAHWPAPEFITAVIGLVAGAILGGVLGFGERDLRTGNRRHRSLTIVLAAIGCYLGWEAAFFIAGVTAAAMAVAAMLVDYAPAALRIPAVAYAAIAAFVQIPLWNTLTAATWYPRSGFGLWPLAAGLFVFFLISQLIRLIRNRDADRDAPQVV